MPPPRRPRLASEVPPPPFNYLKGWAGSPRSRRSPVGSLVPDLKNNNNTIARSLKTTPNILARQLGLPEAQPSLLISFTLLHIDIIACSMKNYRPFGKKKSEEG